LDKFKELYACMDSSHHSPRASKSWRQKLPASSKNISPPWRVIVIGGHTRSIGKTQLVCDVIAAFPQAHWIAGKITQYGHGVCAQNGDNCDCAPTEHVCAINWETQSDSGTDSARFLAAGAQRSFWLRTKQGFSCGRPSASPNRVAGNFAECRNGSSSTYRGKQFLAPILETEPLHRGARPAKEDFKDSAAPCSTAPTPWFLRGASEALRRQLPPGPNFQHAC